MATSTPSRRPIKGILKNKGSAASSAAASDQQPGGAVEQVMRKKSQKWDELSILATTYRLGCTDYDLTTGHEPGTPRVNTPDQGEDTIYNTEANEAMTPEGLAKKLAAVKTSDSSCQVDEEKSRKEEEWKLFLERRERRRQFEIKRKLHYDEGQNIKLARQLISEDFKAEEEMGENAEFWSDTKEENTTKDESEVSTAINQLQAISRD